MVLQVTFDTPTPLPTCGFKVLFRSNSASAYTTELLANSATGLTYELAAPSCIEGVVQSDCCESLISAGTPFGINSYVEFEVEAEADPDLQQFKITVTSEYGNPYDTVINGVVSYTVAGVPNTYNYSVTYDADSTEQEFIVGFVNPLAIVTGTSVTSYNPVYTYGGELQQYDPLRTPGYFEFYHATGSTWDGSPTSLPSFNQVAFIATEQDESENVTEGNLLVSWIYNEVYEDGVTPYDNITFAVYDSDDNNIGTTTVPVTPVGLRNASIKLTKDTIALTTSNEFTLVTFWDDNTEIVSKSFYLPPATV
jgi:hypothetical protein